MISSSDSYLSDGENFLQVLANAKFNSLENLAISGEYKWFKDRDECMGPLLTILARQTMLKKLCMSGNRLIATQIDQIRQVVTKTAPSCQLEGEIKI